MKALVISDTHGNSSLAFKAHSLAEPVDIIFHLGDGSGDADLMRNVLDVNLINVAGNCDIGSTAPRELVLECEGKKILLSHGDIYGVKSGLVKLEQRGREVGADAVLFGHSHLATNELRPGLLLLNPGTLTVASHRRTYAVIDVSPDGISASIHDID
ncbi:MAG: YfcE family phosphodiesterase [Geobacter sp.]|nr:YfcE family phosphodiesterase [Geobacter sp.]